MNFTKKYSNALWVLRIFILVSFGAIGASIYFNFSPKVFALEFNKGLSKRKKVEVLFIGNSFTYYNQMPDMLSAISKFNGNSAYYIESDSVAYGGFTLEKHWEKKQALQKINSKKWDYIIFQGQSSTMVSVNGKNSFDNYLKAFVESIRSVSPDTRIILFSTWSYHENSSFYFKNGIDYFTMLKDTQEGYYQFAKKFNTGVVYTGTPFYEANKRGINPYSDGHHPNRNGSYLVAILFYKNLISDANVNCEDIKFAYGINEKVCNSMKEIALY
ncbi:MAG: hypothetical protein PQ612_00915 [Rickettsiales bacterium]|nr:hypothetical protein [Pseudomonadota bacterium]MDA0965524.1 hypothetical protein [Pseudomonadota bacterium]MDG4542848.1 hypothetical protein [Rickettsiales bacterium]MDG4544704.1 hypothetical protein [Rickettsiales bacterium]MDG4546826.1 hypothetical protein [Rickettsiales bacterium]